MVRMSQLRPRIRRHLRTEAIHLRQRIAPWQPEQGAVQWLFVATFANGGSTALAKLLVSSPDAAMLHSEGEGQWLVPQLAGAGQRYDADVPIDWGKVRSVWMHEIRVKRRPCVVVEKSPPNLVRLRPILAAFADMPATVLRFTRDPYAVCASWSKRYTPGKLARDWGEQTQAMAPESNAFFAALGGIWGNRAALMVELADVTDLTLRYEDLVADPGAALAPLKARISLLAKVRADAQLSVKDYRPQGLADMNGDVVARLTSAQIDAISAGLAPHRASVAALGYGLR